MDSHDEISTEGTKPQPRENRYEPEDDKGDEAQEIVNRDKETVSSCITQKFTSRLSNR